jgi:hypothetical protein
MKKYALAFLLLAGSVHAWAGEKPDFVELSDR